MKDAEKSSSPKSSRDARLSPDHSKRLAMFGKVVTAAKGEGADTGVWTLTAVQSRCIALSSHYSLVLFRRGNRSTTYAKIGDAVTPNT